MNSKKIVKNILIILTLLILNFQTACASSLQDGVTAYNHSNFMKAEQCFKSALTQSPNNSNIRYYLAITQVRIGKYDEARANYQYIINHFPNSNAATYSAAGLDNISGLRTAHAIHPTTKPKATPPTTSPKANSPSKVTINVEDHNNCMIVKNVKLNGVHNAGFIVDTGASNTVISMEYAKKIGIDLTNAQPSRTSTANGIIKTYVTTIKSIEINGLIAQNVPISITESNLITPEEQNNNIVGLLGMSFLHNFTVTIDKEASTLTLEKKR